MLSMTSCSASRKRLSKILEIIVMKRKMKLPRESTRAEGRRRCVIVATGVVLEATANEAESEVDLPNIGGG